jgi:hypothetical protein
MIFTPFLEKFPKIAEKDTRTFAVLDDSGLLKNQYGLFETYCNDPACDCQRVLLNVIDLKTGETSAIIAFGWKSKEFYSNQIGTSNENTLHSIKGPALDTTGPKTEKANLLLEQVGYILKDKSYIGKLIRHYNMFKETIMTEYKKKRLY